MIENIYLCRHGYRADFDDPKDQASPTGTYNDPRLSDRGLNQADELSAFLAHPPPPMPHIDLVFVSPFYRCLQTAKPLADALGKPMHCEHGAGEWFSKAAPGTGLHARPHPPAVLQKLVPDMPLHPSYDATYHPNREGESMEELQERTDTFVEAFVRRIDAEYPDAKTIVVVSHAGLVITMGRALIGDYDHEVVGALASVSLYRRRGLPPLPGLVHVEHKHPERDLYGSGSGPRDHVTSRLSANGNGHAAALPSAPSAPAKMPATLPPVSGNSVSGPNATPDKTNLDERKDLWMANHPNLDQYEHLRGETVGALSEAQREERAGHGPQLRKEDARIDVEGGDPEVAYYARKALQRQGGAGLQMVDHAADKLAIAHEPVLGAWDQLMNGHTEHLSDGQMRAWTFRQLQLDDKGDVILDRGDGKPFTDEEKHHHGLRADLHKYCAHAKKLAKKL